MLLLAQAEREMRIYDQLAVSIAERRDPSRIVHPLDDILRARVLAITCGSEDADNLDALRDDPGFRFPPFVCWRSTLDRELAGRMIDMARRRMGNLLE